MKKFKVLIISVSGIGNTIMQSPMISSVLNDSRYEVDILFGNDAMAGVYANSVLIKQKIILSNFVGFFGKLKLVYTLFLRRYDCSIACFPSHRLEFHLLPFLSGIRKRCFHKLDWGNVLKMTFLSNFRIPANPSLHDIEQNLNLLQFLDIKKPTKYFPHLACSAEDTQYAEKFILKNNIKKGKIIGFHSGSGDLDFKRWGDNKYAALASNLRNRGFNVVAFGSGKELDFFVNNSDIILFTGTINQTAAMISFCDFFISGDTGLMHIAASVGSKQIVIWKGTNFNRTSPRNINNSVINLHFAPQKIIYNYPFKKNIGK